MSIRTNLTANGSWTQIGTAPATAQLISPDATGTEVMVYTGASAPATNSDGFVLSAGYQSHTFGGTAAIWAQIVQATGNALLACQ
jgi:hypothetical protein